MYRKGMNQLLPFVITVARDPDHRSVEGHRDRHGRAASISSIRANFHAAMTLTQDGKNYLLRLQKDVSFLNKALLRSYFDSIQEGGYLIIDASRAQFVDQDILETIQDFVAACQG